jgi:hypothetical protein
MAEARFAVHLPSQRDDSVSLSGLKEWLRDRFRGSNLFRIASLPNRAGGEFGIVVVFNGDKTLMLLWLIAAELQEAVSKVVPGASVELTSAESAEEHRPVWDRAVREGATANRYVNTPIVHAGTEASATMSQSLALATDYEVLLNIGDYLAGSLLSRDDASFPDGLLPDQGLWLSAVLAQDDHSDPVTRSFFLPRAAPSFACECEPGAASHADGCARRPWVRLPLRTPGQPAIVRAELAIYYKAAAVHVQRLTLPFGEGIPGGFRIDLIGRLTRTFTYLGRLADRSVSLVTADASSRVIVNSLDFTHARVALSARAGDTSAMNARETLRSVHLRSAEGGLASNFAADFSKEAAAFQADLHRLAVDGATLYAALFGSGDASTLPGLLRREAEARRRPPVIQVIDGQAGELATLWPLIYDLPLSRGPRFKRCLSLEEFGPGGGAATDPPLVCPYEQDHYDCDDGVLCPFGFWGLSCVIEQPPRVERDLESVVWSNEEELSFIVAPDTSLDSRLTERHLRLLAGRLPERTVSLPPIATREQLREALTPAAMDVVYFYCHSGYERRSTQGAPENYLNLGDYQIWPLDVQTWARTRWAAQHWPTRHPLVILNGCHTTDMTSGTLNTFVSAFADHARASGVVGTEVTLEQGLAGWAMELMLAALARGATVGNAIREVRWAMLRRGNVMGFAYTPYCLANLVLRRPLGED